MSTFEHPLKPEALAHMTEQKKLEKKPVDHERSAACAFRSAAPAFCSSRFQYFSRTLRSPQLPLSALSYPRTLLIYRHLLRFLKLLFLRHYLGTIRVPKILIRIKITYNRYVKEALHLFYFDLWSIFEIPRHLTNKVRHLTNKSSTNLKTMPYWHL